MANEITITNSISVLKGTLEFNARTIRTSQNQGVARAGSFTVDVPTTEVTIDFGDIDVGYVRIYNLDTDNFVLLRFATTVDAMKLPAGGIAMFCLASGANVIAIANTAACKIQVDAINV
jgi:hypothetical protein